MAKERAQFFSSKEQELLIEGYEEEKEVLTMKSNTARAAKMREEAWQRIADKLNVAFDGGYKRTWQQVKVKYKNILQTAKKKKIEVEVTKTESDPPTPIFSPPEELVLQYNLNRPLVEGIPGVSFGEAAAGYSCSYISAESKPRAVDHSNREILSNHTHLDVDLDHSSSQERANSAGDGAGGICGEGPVDDVKVLYRRYLKKEMENRDQEMAYRALKMRKLEKEILLLDKQLDKR